MPLYPARSWTALQPLAAAFGGVPQAAEAVLRVTNANMDRAVRAVSVERGYDPRDFTLVAFGGAGPLHACELAESLGIRRVLVPRYPGVLSALGMVMAPLTREFSAPVMRVLAGPADAAALQALASKLAGQARAALRAESHGATAITTETLLSMRYAGQSFELPITAPLTRRGPSLGPAALTGAFHAAHLQRYGHAGADRPVEVVMMRVRASLPPPDVDLTPAFEPGVARAGTAEVWFGRPRRTAIWRRAHLRPDVTLRGPAIVTQLDATTVIPPGWVARAGAGADLIIEPV